MILFAPTVPISETVMESSFDLSAADIYPFTEPDDAPIAVNSCSLLTVILFDVTVKFVPFKLNVEA